ncbi:unnamed protein product, partial [Iphiclides podalirius]
MLIIACQFISPPPLGPRSQSAASSQSGPSQFGAKSLHLHESEFLRADASKRKRMHNGTVPVGMIVPHMGTGVRMDESDTGPPKPPSFPEALMIRIVLG